MKNSAQLFRALHEHSSPLILPNAWDAASARIFEDLGAKAIATTSAGVAWSLGYPDGRILPARLQAQVAENILRVIKVPLSVDFENGYSDDPIQVGENIKPLLDAGVAGINMEDGTDAPELLAAKITAIRKIAGDLFINVRTDVYLAGLVSNDRRVDEVGRRSKLYAEAGGSGLFVPFLADEEEIKQVVGLITLPLNVMAVPQLPNAAVLGKLGVKRLSAGSGISQVIWQQAATLAGQFLKGGDSTVLDRDPMAYGKLQELFSSSI